jgi:hypothetical protein
MNKTINFPTFIASFGKNSFIGDVHTLTLNTCEFVKIGTGNSGLARRLSVAGLPEIFRKIKLNIIIKYFFRSATFIIK